MYIIGLYCGQHGTCASGPAANCSVKMYDVHCGIVLWSTSSPSLSSITRQALTDLFQPRLIVSLKVFQVVFVHLFYNLALFFAFHCCSFLLNLVANLICIFLVSCQLILLSYHPKFLHSFCGYEGCCPAAVLKNVISIDVSCFLSFFLRVQISLPCKRNGRASALHTFMLENFWTRDGLKVLFRIPSV